MLKRHEIQVMRRADHTWTEIAALSGVSEKTARRVAAEAPVTSVDNPARARATAGWPAIESGGLSRGGGPGADGGQAGVKRGIRGSPVVLVNGKCLRLY
jgi:hypothetical protein